MHDSGGRIRKLASAGLALLAAACAATTPAPPQADPGSATLWGFVRLVPREGVKPMRSGGGAYGDRRLRDVTFVDYDRPGFAVVWAEGDAAPGHDAEMVLSDGPTGPRLAPEHAAVGGGGRVVVRNATRSPHTLSCPEVGVLRRMAPGESLALRGDAGSELSIFLLGATRAESRVFVAPGAFAVTRDDGRYELRGLRPGSKRLHAWHPRFPSAAEAAEAASGAVTRLDLELGVDRAEEAAGAAR